MSEWTDEQHEAYRLGMMTEREHQNALSRLSMEKYEARIAELEAELAGYRGVAKLLMGDNQEGADHE